MNNCTKRCRRDALRFGAWIPIILCLALTGVQAEDGNDILITTLTDTVKLLEEVGLPYEPEVAKPAVITALIKGFDPEGRLLTPVEHDHMKKEAVGTYFSPGLMIARSNGTVFVTRVLEDSPAAQAGIEAGAELTGLDDANSETLLLTDILNRLRDDEKETTLLTLALPGGVTNRVEVGRVWLQEPAICAAEEFPADLCYIRLNGLYPDSGREVVETIQGWAENGRYGLILDLRGSNGLDEESVIAIASAFSPEGSLLYSFRDKDDQDLKVQKAASSGGMNMPVMVLIDKQTAGAAEVLTAVLRSSVRGAMLIGQPTSGDMLVRDTIPLKTGEQIYIATRRLVLADGTEYKGHAGVRPDVVVDATLKKKPEYEPESENRKSILREEEINEQLRWRVRKDPALRRAVDVLLGLKALNIKTLGYTPHTSG